MYVAVYLGMLGRGVGEEGVRLPSSSAYLLLFPPARGIPAEGSTEYCPLCMGETSNACNSPGSQELVSPWLWRLHRPRDAHLDELCTRDTPQMLTDAVKTR